MFSRSLFIVAVLVACVFASSHKVKHVHFIEQNVNYLFRGGSPDPKHVFDYDYLVHRMASQALSEGNVVLPSDFYLIDINLLDPNNTAELPDIEAEEQFFQSNSSAGEFIHYKIVGEETSPFDVDSSKLPGLASSFDSWSADKLPTFVDSIRNTLTATDYPLPAALYIHCECGCDRTGEVAGAYYLQYMNMTLHDAHQLDMTIAKREIDTVNLNALEWYCFYLKYAKNYDLTCEL